MKKRIASFLLTVLMVLSAVPLFAFTATAEQSEEEAFDYDSLYVQLGLSYQFDTFKTNPIWDPEGTAVTVPKELYAMTGEDGELLFDTKGERVVESFDAGGTLLSVGLTPAFSAAQKEYAKAWNEILASFRTTGNRTLSVVFPTIGVKSHHDKTGEQQAVSHTLEDGYLQFKGASGYLESKLSLSGESYQGASSIQYVLSPGDRLGQRYFVLYRGVSLGLTPGTDGALVFKNGGMVYGNVDYGTISTDGSIAPDKVGDLTVMVEHPEVSGADARKALSGRLVIHYNTKKLVDNSISYTAGVSDDILKISMINYYRSTNQKLYAIRIYDRALTADDIALNHFADLAKYYKLNLDGYVSLTSPEKLELAKTFANETVGNHDEAYVAELRLHVTEKIEDLVYGALLLEDTINSGCAEFTELAKSLKLDISGVRALPIEYRQTVYSAVLGLIVKDKESIEAVIEQTINGIIEENFGDYVTEQTSLTYKDLYVKQDNLKVWVDFFAAKESDGLVYDQVSYPDGTEQSETNHIGNLEKPYNADQLFAKYRFRGEGENSRVNSFYFKAMPTLGSTNIRAYGDGCLKTGYQNMIGLYSPGSMLDATYQLVTGTNGKNGARAGGSYTQLDGIRFNYGTDAQGKGFIGTLTYYGFGTADNGATIDGKNMVRLSAGKQVTFGDMTFSSDVTMVVKKAKERPFMYEIGYMTDSNGNPAYIAKLDSAPDVSALTPIGTAGYYEYKTQGEAKLYVDKAGNLYTNKNGWQKNFYLVDKGNGSYAYCDLDGNEWILTDAESINETTRKATGKTADNEAVTMVGPLYDNNKITEAPVGSMNAYGPFEFMTMTVSAYANGTLAYKVEDVTYRNDQQGLLGSGADMTIYAIRTYDCVLTQEEIRQNHFADLAGYYGFDLSLYAILTDEQKMSLYDSLATMQLGDNRESCILRYENVLSELLYSFESESEAALSFHKLCENYLLNVDSLLKLSVESQENVFESFADVNPESLHYSAILQARLEKAVEDELFNNYEGATIHKTIDFSSWQLHVYGDPGFRAVFELNEQHLSTFTARNAMATIGIMIAEKGNKSGQIASIDGLTVSIGSDGTLVFPDGVETTIAYENGSYTDAVIQENGEVFFSEGVFPDEESYGQKYYCVAFVVLKTADGKNIVYLQNAPYGRDNAPSLGEFSEQALALNWTYPNVQTVLTKYLEDDGYNKVAAFIGNKALSDLRVSLESSNRTALDRVNALMDFYFGVSLIEGEIEESGIYIGKFDSVYDKSSYGVTVQGGDLYIWYNDEAQLDLLIDLLDEILAYHYNLGGDIVLPNGFNEVRKVMPAQ